MSVRPSTALRIGDAERDRAASDLGDHYAAGRLTRSEFDDRLEHVWQARTGAELAPLFDDLPTVGGAPVPSGPSRAPCVRIDRGACADQEWGHARPHGPPRGARLFPIMITAIMLTAVIVSRGGPPWPLFVIGWLVLMRFVGPWRRRSGLGGPTPRPPTA